MSIRLFVRSMLIFCKGRVFTDIHPLTPPEEQAFREFLQTRVGKKVHANLVNSSFEQDRWSTLQTRNGKHAAGFAAGWRACVAHFEALSGAPPQEGTYENDPTKGADDLEHLSP